MRTSIGLVSMAVTAVLLAGCGSDEQQAFDRSLRQYATSQPVGQSIRPRSQASTAEALEVADLAIPAGAGSEDYVRIALERSPSLRAACYKVERLRQRIPQETSLPDPTMEIDPYVLNTGDVNTSKVVALVRQTLPLPEKLKTRGRIAEQELAAAMDDLGTARLTVIGDARRAYWSYYIATQAVELTQRSRARLTEFQQAAEAQYRSGSGSQQAVLKASVELGLLGNSLADWQQRHRSAEAMLNSLMDRRIDAPLPAPRVTELATLTLQLERLLEQAVRKNPELSAVRKRIEGERQRLRLANLNRWPDMTVGFNYEFDQGHGISNTNQFGPSISFNIPIWFARLNAAEAEAHNGILENIAMLTDANNRLAFRVQDALVKVETQQRIAMLFHKVIVPQAQQSLDASMTSYRAGGVDFSAIIDTWRKRLDYELMYYQSLAQFEQNLADLQQAVGADLPRQTTQPASEPTSAMAE